MSLTVLIVPSLLDVFDLRTTSSQSCAAVPRKARILKLIDFEITQL